MAGHVRTNAEDARRSWLKLLNPETLRSNLLSASLYLSAYEILRSSIIDQIKSFYSLGWTPEGPTTDPRYSCEVLRLDKSPLRASALWLKANGVIDDSDLAKLDHIRLHRNELAHDLPKFIATHDASVDVSLFGEMCTLVTKIDRWWITEVELPTNPDFDGVAPEDVDVDGILSGNMMFIRLIVQIATGSPEESSFFYEKFKEHVKNAAEPTVEP